MDGAAWAVTLAGAGAVAAVNLWFLGRRRGAAAAAAVGSTGAQEVRVRVGGGYDPAEIEVRAGRPVRLLFLREETEGGSDTVLLPEWRIARRLPAHVETAVEFTPVRPGAYEFTCGRHALRGRIVVRP